MQISLYTFTALSSVLLPTLSSHQDNHDEVKNIFRKVTHATAFVVIPIMAGIAVTSKEIILVLLTEKWLPCLKIMQYSCIYYLATPFMLINIQLYFALGRSYIRVKTETVRLCLILGSLVLCIIQDWSVYQLAFANAIIAVLIATLSFFEASKLIKYSVKELLLDLYKPAICGTIMSVTVVLAGVVALQLNITVSLVVLLIKIVTGITIYTVASLALKPEAYYEVLDLLRKKFHRRKNET